MALFESFPVHNGKPIFLAEHLNRLKSACDRCGFHLDVNALELLPDVIRQIQFDAFLRIYVTGGDGSPTCAATACRIVLLAEPRERVAGAVVDNGYRLAIHPVPHLPVFHGIKTANYWANINARQLAIERQNHEALLFNDKGELMSACMANVFVAKEGIIKTPGLICGARDGVLRRWVLDRCEAQECSVFVDDLRNADEIFLTSSGIGIMPAVMIEGRPLARREFSTPLRNEYEACLAGLLRGGEAPAEPSS